MVPRLSILLVDDNHFDRELARWALASLLSPPTPLAITEAATWDEARVTLDAGGVDLVLLDFHLPGRTGLDVLDELRGRPDRPPVIMMTGRDDIETVAETLRAGADDYVRKGIDWAPELCRATRRAIAAVRRSAGSA